MNKLKALLGFDPKTTTVKTELIAGMTTFLTMCYICLLYTSPSPRDVEESRMPSSA